MSDGSDPPPSIERVRPLLTRDTIVAAAFDLVSEHGVDELSLRRLARRLGVTAPALYAHVSDKRDLLRSVADMGFRQLLERYSYVKADDPIDHLRQLNWAYVNQARDEPEVFRLMFMFRSSALQRTAPDGSADDEILESAGEAFDLALAYVATAIMTGALHPDRDPLATALALWTTSHGAATVALLELGFDTARVDELVDTVIDASLAGLRLPPNTPDRAPTRRFSVKSGPDPRPNANGDA